jgi:dihydrofolate synthase / folylpolyglutamate synthase
VGEFNFPYYSTVDQIYHAEWSTLKLARLELLRESIRTLWPHGHPTRLVHVAGTGGKGSTCRFVEVGFGAVGRAGAFMSPHLFDYRERFSLDGDFASQEDISELFHQRVQPHCVHLARKGNQYVHTFHEVSILLALSLFEKYEVDWAAMETGVGGRYDQTRALDVDACVLTNVGGDHPHLLGRELWQRVLDKAGIARAGIPFFTSESNPDSLEIITAVCRDAGAPLQVIGPADVSALEQTLQQQALSPSAEEALVGAGYQKWNAALSMAVVRHFYPALAPESILARYAQAQLPGRFWKVGERLYADIAHNEEKIRALTGELQHHFQGKELIIVLGVTGQRAPAVIFRQLAPLAKCIIVTGASYKGQDPAKVGSALEGVNGGAPIMAVPEPRQALEVAQSMQGPEDVILLTGSTYMIEQALNPDPYLRHLSATFGWRLQTDTEATGTVELTLPKPHSPLR